MILRILTLAAWACAQAPAPVTGLKGALAQESRVALFVPFVPARADFDDGAGAQLMAVAESLAALPELRLTVEAHVFSMATPEQNLALSQSRARAVVQELETLGVPAGRLTPKGYGQQRPLVRQDKEGYASGPNERIDLYNPDYKGVRSYLAAEVQGIERGEGRPLFQLMPDYYIARYDHYDSWSASAPGTAGGQVLSLQKLSGPATVVVYRHFDADQEGARLPDPRAIASDYVLAARQAGGVLVSTEGDATVLKLESAAHEIWIEVDAHDARGFIVTTLDRASRFPYP